MTAESNFQKIKAKQQAILKAKYKSAVRFAKSKSGSKARQKLEKEYKRKVPLNLPFLNSEQ